jgi:hypothetical protein
MQGSVALGAHLHSMHMFFHSRIQAEICPFDSGMSHLIMEKITRQFKLKKLTSHSLQSSASPAHHTCQVFHSYYLLYILSQLAR